VKPAVGTDLEDNGWIEGRWEEIDASAEGRPRRRLYRLTPNGVAWARQALDETATMLGFRPAGGYT
jgi:DNA-binding PadR family transcriptional regulator